MKKKKYVDLYVDTVVHIGVLTFSCHPSYFFLKMGKNPSLNEYQNVTLYLLPV